MKTLSPHILIVDDNPKNIQVLGTALTQKKNYKVTVVQDGFTALEAVTKSKPDLILLDVIMPGMDGFEVCKTLKDNPQTQDVEIIFITAAVAGSDELKGLELGAVDYIHKPFSMPLVLAKVELHLERVHSKRELRIKNALLEENLKLSLENAKLHAEIAYVTRCDLKNTLNPVLGYPQIMLADKNLTDAQQEYLAGIIYSGEEMLAMINNSDNLYRLERGHYEYQPEALDLILLLSTVVQGMKMFAQTLGVKLMFNDENDIDQPLLISGASDLSHSLFSIIIRHAIKTSAFDSIIDIRIKPENSYATVLVNYPGSLSQERCDKFFEKTALLTQFDGIGLGAYTAKLITEVQKGHLSLKSDNEQITWSLSLPLFS